MTNTQLWLAIAVPMVFNTTALLFVYWSLNAKIDALERHLTEMWRTQLQRVEDVLDARLTHLEESWKAR